MYEVVKMMEERQHGDVLEHHHEGYDYWHPITRVHKMEDEEVVALPDEHVLAPVIPYSEEQEIPRGLQVKPFDWVTWDAGCHAKGICQGYHSIAVPRGQPGDGAVQELHHRPVSLDLRGIAEQYWQCPHCRPLQKLIQWAEGARLETYNVETRGNKVILWLKVSSGQWYVLVTYGTIQRVASWDGNIGTAYAVGNYPPQQMPDEIAVTLARRFWYRMTKGYWSDTPQEDEE
jgi:hypothetical protein